MSQDDLKYQNQPDMTANPYRAMQDLPDEWVPKMVRAQRIAAEVRQRKGWIVKKLGHVYRSAGDPRVEYCADCGQSRANERHL